MNLQPKRPKQLENPRLPGAADDLPGPAWGIDVAAGRLLWANAEGSKLFGYSPERAQTGQSADALALDKAMPALRRLTTILDALVAGATCTEVLVFWTDQGPRSVTCRIHCPDAARQSDVVLLQASAAGQADTTQPTAQALSSIFPRCRDRKPLTSASTPQLRAAGTLTSSVTVAEAAGEQDLEALQQIAQQIRQQRGPGPTCEPPPAKPDTPPQSVQIHEGKSTGGPSNASRHPVTSATKFDRLSEDDQARFADLGHELRTPVGSISGFADMMLTERFGPLGHEKYAGYVRDIQASAGHVLSLIEEFTTSERDGVAPDLSFSEVDVNQVADECLSAIRPLAEQAGVRLAGALAARLPRVIADRRSLKQIFLNLLSNAIRFNASGGTATLTTSYRVGGAICVEVADTGIGMSPEMIANATGAEGAAGSGFPSVRGRHGRGLALTSGLVSANGAKLAIESTPSSGTTVGIVFPPDRLVPV